MSTYTQHYSNFIGVDLSSDPRAVSRNRLSYAVNMWRDYESEQGEAIETFPGFRRLVRDLGAVHGLFAYRAKGGEEYLVVHAGTRLYCFESEAIAAMYDVYLTKNSALENVTLADKDSQGFIFNNNLYILDGEHFIVVSSVTDQSGATSVTAGEVDAYIPTTYFDGKPLEQRNMLVDEAYEIFTFESAVDAGALGYEYYDEEVVDKQQLPTSVITNNKSSTNYLVIDKKGYNVKISNRAFENAGFEEIDIICTGSLELGSNAFKNCKNLKKVNVCIFYNPNVQTSEHEVFVTVNSDTFAGCDAFEKVAIYSNASMFNDNSFVMNEISYAFAPLSKFEKRDVEYDKKFDIAEIATKILSIEDKDTGEEIPSEQYNFTYSDGVPEGMKERRIDFILINSNAYNSGIKVRLELAPLHFSTIENVKNFHDGNPDYEGTGVEAINGCTKSAVFDGRIFLTGNPALPNTVFYSNRNNTGANDPTYWGAYNYFNDGDGNTPNVDLLSTPSMLMVLKNNTVQDGSVYYHVPAFNEDEYSKDLVPKIYPSTSGAAGLGSAGDTVPGTTACNFLDDPVFLSVRGLESVGKQQVNLERTITHRSSNVDRLLIKEDLSSASLAEWKGYLVICCDGRFYLADSRQIHQHPDGSYQYEWYYLEGLGCYDEYSGGYRYLRTWPAINDEGETLANCTLIDGRTIGEAFEISTDAEDFNGFTWEIGVYSAQRPDGKQFYFYAHGNYALMPVDEERKGTGEFYPAKKIVVVGERLFFGTADGDVCVINTDKRGVPDYEGQIFESDRISSKWYTFAGARYPSICVTALDDCSKKSLSKGTIPGTTVARFKMMPGSRVTANVSLNGRDFKKIGEAFASRYDIGDAFFGNFSFTENEDSVVVLRELTRNWVDKQYSFVSDGFREPFGLYEISYLYTIKGKIRKIFALT